MKLSKRLRRILNFAFEANERAKFSRIADLSAALAIEWRLVEDDGDRFALPGLGDACPVLDQGQHHALAFMAGVAGEFGRTDFLGDIEPDIVGRLGS